jgi:N6-L-threonylcarbamoyladenine synthase
MLVLGIESSCDETAAAVVRDGREILTNIVASQHDLHRPFGGVVPEVAARAHVERITAVTDEALRGAGVKPEELGGIAVVNQPGLVGALLVGLSAAKALALAWDRPYVGVDHLLAHVYASTLAGFDAFPHVSLVASGGHTCLYLTRAPGEVTVLGQTADDAAGEAFDKAAKLLGLGFPGGPALARCAEKGNPQAVAFPRSHPNQKPGDTLDFSFSGLKTALYYHLRERSQNGHREITDQEREDVAASFQETVCEIMTEKILAACRSTGCPALAIGGGVACNRRLRAMLTERAGTARVFFPPPALCADNAAMTAGLGYHYLARGDRADWSLDVDPTPKRAG